MPRVYKSPQQRPKTLLKADLLTFLRVDSLLLLGILLLPTRCGSCSFVAAVALIRFLYRSGNHGVHGRSIMRLLTLAAVLVALAPSLAWAKALFK